jgi:hypothetical protein
MNMKKDDLFIFKEPLRERQFRIVKFMFSPDAQRQSAIMRGPRLRGCGRKTVYSISVSELKRCGKLVRRVS